MIQEPHAKGTFSVQIVTSEHPTDEDLFYLAWGRETFKENLATLNDTLKLFITLNVGLLSAFVAFHTQVLAANVSATLRLAPAALLLVSLSASILGIYPVTQSVNLLSPDEIRAFKTSRARFKRIALAIAALGLLCAFGVLVALTVA